MDAPPRPGPDAFGADATEPDAAPSLDTAQDDAASFDAPPDTALDAGPRDVLHGYAQKGPFVAGSRVSIIALDSELFPTGVTYMTETVGALGEYEMRTLPPGFYQVEVTGEVTRDFDFSRTGTERTLRAIVQTHVRGAFDASVTLITHLTTPRIRVLVRGGVELEAARAQAERELFTGLDGLTPPGFDPGVVGTAAVATSADSPGSRWLLFLSSQLHESATVDVDSVADDLRDGTLAPDALTLFTHWMSVTRVQWSYGKSWPSPVAAHDAERDALVATWLAHGIVGDPPDIRGLFDEDFDEVPTLTDNCWAIANLDQLDSDGDGEGDACDLTPNDECPSGQWPVVDPATGASYCVTRCLDSGYPACPADMDCAGDSPRNPGTFRPSFADYGGFFSFCVRSCDLHAADPCPEGYSCHRYTTPVAPTGVPPGDRHTHCLPFAYGMNHTSCSGWDGFRPWCLDGYLCPNGGRGEACREVCDPADAGSCPSGTCTPIVTAGPAPYGLCPAM